MQSKYSKRTILWIVPILLIAALIFYFRPASDQEQYIQAAKAYAVPAHEDITFEQSFNNSCNEGEWTFFETNRGQKVVEFSGECNVKDATQVNLQFLMDDDLNVEIGALLVDYNNVTEDEKPTYFDAIALNK